MATEVEFRLKDLMVRAQTGDGEAYAQLLTDVRPLLRGYFVRRMRGAESDCEDLMQETLLAIHAKRDVYDPARPFTPWLYALARYKLLDHLRRTGGRPTAPLDEAAEISSPENTDEAAVRFDLSKLLGFLPRRHRKVLADVKLSGMSTEEAARQSGMTGLAVRLSVHRSLKALARKVRGED